MVRQAAAASRKGSLLGRVKRDLQGRRIDATIRLQAEYSPESVQRFVDGRPLHPRRLDSALTDELGAAHSSPHSSSAKPMRTVAPA